MDNAKPALLKKGKALSCFIEKSLRSLSAMEIIGDLCRELNLDCVYIAGKMRKETGLISQVEYTQRKKPGKCEMSTSIVIYQYTDQKVH